MATEKRLIDANAFKSFLCKCCNILHPDEPCEPPDCNVMAVIDEQPTVDAVEVVHGRWINKTKVIHGQVDYMFVCSACGFIHWDSITETFNYCPNCGASMSGERKDNES